MQCEKACPVDCIKIDAIKPTKDNDIDCGMTSNDTQKKMIVSRFTIDMSECMYCNLCVYPCPEECIYMVGGPNDKKHEIDYEFSQYQRDGMIFEFADATDEMIRSAGGEKWIERRDEKKRLVQDGLELKGEVEVMIPKLVEEPIESKSPEELSKQKTEDKTSGKLEITSFNQISDKMSRGIAKKAFTASTRNGKDHVAILADVAQALSDAGKITDDIKEILDRLSLVEVLETSNLPASTEVEANILQDSDLPLGKSVEMDIKDLNSIEDKMTRGTAKKAFTAAKRSGEDKLLAVKNALLDAGLINENIDKLLNSFSDSSKIEDLASEDKKTVKPVQSIKENPENKVSDETQINLPLFEIGDLNEIEDKMVRGMAKKIYTVGKRADKSRDEVIAEIRLALQDVDKLDESIEKILTSLKSKS
jgi:formate hydrogenlyase subunit 6/NADH:ubiquinone oxidoreductase subunit I